MYIVLFIYKANLFVFLKACFKNIKDMTLHIIHTMAPETSDNIFNADLQKGNLKLYLLPDKKNSLFIKQT